MTDHDTELVALIDNELDGGAKARLLTRLAQDEAMRERYDALREAGRSIAIALDALLQKAPLPQFRACLPPEDARRAPSGRVSGIDVRELAAGIAACVFDAGAAALIALSLAPGDGNKDWRSSVEEYTSLYTNETFSPLHPDAPLEAIGRRHVRILGQSRVLVRGPVRQAQGRGHAQEASRHASCRDGVVRLTAARTTQHADCKRQSNP